MARAQSQKFLFETDFDEESAEAPPDEAAALCHSAEDLANAERDAMEAGRAAGLAEARAAMEQRTAEALGAIEARLAELAAQAAESDARRERQAIEVAAAVVRKVVPELARRGALEEIEAVVRDCLERHRDEPRVVVRTADPSLDPLRERLDALGQACGFDGRIVLLADDGLSESDVRVEWADGGAERDTARLWAEIDALLTGFLSAGPAAAPEETGDAAAGEDQPLELAQSA